MPIYEYTCKKCQQAFEELVFSSSEKVSCPECGSKSVTKEMSVFGFKSGGKFSSAHGDSCDGCSKGSCSGCGHH